MLKTSRIKQPIERRKSFFRDARMFFISTEGKETEKQYFESELFHNPRIKINVIPTPDDGTSAPQYVFERLKQSIKATCISNKLQPGDQFWLVIDKDRWPDQNIDYIAGKRIKQRMIRLALSNPCFELWLFLHNGDMPSDIKNSRAMEKKLRNQLGSYNKNNLDIEKFKGKITQASKRAKESDKNPGFRWPGGTGTHVYKLIEAINDQSSNI